mgnify:CR=1 FL=1
MTPNLSHALSPNACDSMLAPHSSNPAITRRTFLRSAALGAIALPLPQSSAGAANPNSHAKQNPQLETKIYGLLLGSFLGDAFGGPIEFQDPAKVRALTDAPKKWADDEVLDQNAKRAAASRVVLRSYQPLRPVPEPYAHWLPNAAPGTIKIGRAHV